MRAPRIQIQICRFRLVTDWVHEAMAAPFWRFYWNPTPGAWIERGDTHIDLTPENWVLISPGPPIRTGHTGEFEHFFLHFTLGSEYQPVTPIHLEQKVQGGMSTMLQGMERAARTGTISPITTGLQAVRLVVSALHKIPTELWRPPVTDPRIREAVSRMSRERFSHSTCKEIAEDVGLHPKSFSRLFKQHVGVSPNHYHVHQRIDNAVADLLHTDLSIDQVAQTWGFTDRYHFTHALKNTARYGIL